MFVDRVHAALERADIITPPNRLAVSDFIPRLVIHHLRALNDTDLPDLKDGPAVKKFYHNHFVKSGQLFAREWGLPHAYTLMLGEGKFWQVWGEVLDGMPVTINDNAK